MTLEEFEHLVSSIQALITTLSIIIAGIWVYRRYVIQQERYPNIEFAADINFIGIQEGYWVVELIALIENKGKVQHRMKEFNFDLNALFPQDPVNTNKLWGGQVDFPNRVAEGSFLPQHQEFFFVDPGLKAKYSYITRVPITTTFLIFHCWFNYVDNRKVGHTAEKTIRVPSQTEKLS